MNLTTIITLWVAGQLPDNVQTLKSCANTLDAAFDLTLETRRNTSARSTAKMLENELRLYNRISLYIQKRILELSLRGFTPTSNSSFFLNPVI